MAERETSPTGHGVRTEPQQARSAQKRHRILNAAQALIHERGYGALAIADVARNAGVGKQTVYQMFANKEAILFALCERKSEHIDSHNEAYLRAALPLGWRAVVTAGIESFYDLNRKDPSLDPIFIASQDVPALRVLDYEQMKARVSSAAALFSEITGLTNDRDFQEFTLTAAVTTASVVRHALLYDDETARRMIGQHIMTNIQRLEMMGARSFQPHPIEPSTGPVSAS